MSKDRFLLKIMQASKAPDFTEPAVWRHKAGPPKEKSLSKGKGKVRAVEEEEQEGFEEGTSQLRDGSEDLIWFPNPPRKRRRVVLSDEEEEETDNQPLIVQTAPTVLQAPDVTEPAVWKPKVNSVSKVKGKARAVEEEEQEGVEEGTDSSEDSIRFPNPPRKRSRVVLSEEEEEEEEIDSLAQRHEMASPLPQQPRIFISERTFSFSGSESPLTPIEECEHALQETPWPYAPAIFIPEKTFPPSGSESPLTPIEECEHALQETPWPYAPAIFIPEKTFPPEIPLTPIDLTDGPQYPAGAPRVKWDNGITTVLPWMEDPKNPGANLLQEDCDHVRLLAEVAREAKLCADIVVLQASDFPTDYLLSKETLTHLSLGKTVLIQGYHHPFGTPETFDAEYLSQEYQLEPGTRLSVHDAARRVQNWVEPFESISGKELVENIHKQDKVQALLDFPLPDATVPLFISLMDHGYQTWTTLGNTQSVPIDAVRSRSWGLVHHAMFHTYPHHDAEGYATFTQVTSGMKFWVIMRPDERAMHSRTRQEVYQQQALFSPANFKYDLGYKRWLITARPGDIIVQPPNAWHEVYTPKASTVRGGHFLPFHTLHLTEVSRNFDHLMPGSFTNNTHPTAPMILARMLLSLVYKPNQSFPEKALKALCQMILNPAYYLVHNDGNHPRLQQLYAARSVSLKKIKERYPGNKILAILTEGPFLAYKYKRKVGNNVGLAIGTEEQAAIELAFHIVILFEFQFSVTLPPPMEQGEVGDIKDLEVPPGVDFIFDSKWEDPGELVNLKRVLEDLELLAVP